ncbi:hypothetical protein LguiB_006361 [Lonicera macranthoides]|uniref:BZIP protein 8 n=1 Tax=Lonicera japonica TaxID=105884 RepID=A0A4Y1JSE6_LONJA|nr:bZIP protein 8 [Lonicera japonica]
MSNLRPTGSSSTSEGDLRYAMMDEKKRKRMISNRESARRSRMKKQKLVQNMAEEINRLQMANKDIVNKIDSTAQVYMMYKAENDVLRAQEMELAERLRSLNDILKNSGMMDEEILELPDPLLRPWQLPFTAQQPIAASSGLFHF